MIGGTVRIAVIVASCTLSRPPATFGYFYKSSLRGHEELRLTVVVGVVIGVTVGLAASGRGSVVSTAVVIALPNKSARVSWQAGSGTYLAVGTGTVHVVSVSAGSG